MEEANGIGIEEVNGRKKFIEMEGKERNREKSENTKREGEKKKGKERCGKKRVERTEKGGKEG